MSGQIGIALGVAVLVATIGGSDRAAGLSSFQRAWWMTATFSMTAVLVLARSSNRDDSS